MNQARRAAIAIDSRSDLIDQIYKAALVPELWPQVLEGLAREGGASAGTLRILDTASRCAGNDNTLDHFACFAPIASHSHHDEHLAEAGRSVLELFRPVGEIVDHLHDRRHACWHIGTAVRLPDGQAVAIDFRREVGRGSFSANCVTWFDSLRPHLARACAMSADLQLERAQASVDAMNAFGVAAAYVSTSGAVLVTNDLLQSLGHVVRVSAAGRLMVTDRQADRRLQSALPVLVHDTGTTAIPVLIEALGRSMLIQVTPQRHDDDNPFDQSATLVTFTEFSAEANVPDEAVLMGLFDLSIAEAGVAASLACGLSIKQIAAKRAVGLATVRTQLAQIFHKTGTSQQGQLIALLKGAGHNRH